MGQGGSGPFQRTLGGGLHEDDGRGSKGGAAGGRPAPHPHSWWITPAARWLPHFGAPSLSSKEGRALVLPDALPRPFSPPPTALRGLPEKPPLAPPRGLPGQPGLAPGRHLGTAGSAKPRAAASVAPSRAAAPPLASTCERSSREPCMAQRDRAARSGEHGIGCMEGGRRGECEQGLRARGLVAGRPWYGPQATAHKRLPQVCALPPPASCHPQAAAARLCRAPCCPALTSSRCLARWWRARSS